MVLDLIAGTDAATCVVFDPAALDHLRSVEWDQFSELAADREAEAGNLVLLQTPSDGDYKMRAYVEEAAPVDLEACVPRRTWAHPPSAWWNALLCGDRVPAAPGREASGEVWDDGESPAW